MKLTIHFNANLMVMFEGTPTGMVMVIETLTFTEIFSVTITFIGTVMVKDTEMFKVTEMVTSLHSNNHSNACYTLTVNLLTSQDFFVKSH